MCCPVVDGILFFSSSLHNARVSLPAGPAVCFFVMHVGRVCTPYTGVPLLQWQTRGRRSGPPRREASRGASHTVAPPSPHPRLGCPAHECFSPATHGSRSVRSHETFWRITVAGQSADTGEGGRTKRGVLCPLLLLLLLSSLSPNSNPVDGQLKVLRNGS